MNDVTEITGLRRYPLARRGFVMTSLISGFTLATQRVEAQAIHTDTTGIDAGEVQIPVKDGNLPAYYARPAKGPLPHRPGQRGNLRRPRVHQGHLPPPRQAGLHGGGPRDLCPHRRPLEDDRHRSRSSARSSARSPTPRCCSDLDATLAWAAKNKGSASAIAETGFCRGGRNTWLYAAHNPNLKAAVAFYGPVKGAPTDIQPKTRSTSPTS